MTQQWNAEALRESLLWTASSLAALGKEQDVIVLEGRRRNVGEILDEANEALEVATPPASAQPERDWELTCEDCDGDGFVYVERRVGPCATDIQTFKEDCECCDGRGFTISFADIPGIAEYVRKSRPAPASAQDDAKDERQPLFWYRPRSDDGYEGPIHNDRIEDVRKQSGAWVPLYPGFAKLPKPLYDLRYHGEFIRGWNQCLREVSASVAAPAAGDARDAARYRALRRKVCIAGGKFHILNVAPTYVAPNAAVELDSVLDDIAASQQQEG